jgi:hypothetical protein
MSKRLLDKLEKYEQEAYDCAFGNDWLENVGEGFKFYIKYCVNNNVKPSIKGFERYIDDLADKQLK